MALLLVAAFVAVGGIGFAVGHLTAGSSTSNNTALGAGNGRGNGFYIDGVENYINSGGVRLSVSQEAVQEFQIATYRFSAEQGRSAASAVNVVTKTGTDQLHGAARFGIGPFNTEAHIQAALAGVADIAAMQRRRRPART